MSSPPPPRPPIMNDYERPALGGALVMSDELRIPGVLRILCAPPGAATWGLGPRTRTRVCSYGASAATGPGEQGRRPECPKHPPCSCSKSCSGARPPPPPPCCLTPASPCLPLLIGPLGFTGLPRTPSEASRHSDPGRVCKPPGAWKTQVLGDPGVLCEATGRLVHSDPEVTGRKAARIPRDRDEGSGDGVHQTGPRGVLPSTAMPAGFAAFLFPCTPPTGHATCAA